MNHKHCRPLTDRKNVLNVFAKHTKSQGDIRVIPDCNSDSSRAKKTVRSGNTCKVKRLKSRKERSRMTGEKRQDVQPPCCHQSRRESKMMAHSHCCSHSHNRPLHHPSKEKTFIMAGHGQEPCIITHGRLIGHRGLFNREVKSVDIERLVSDKMKTKLHSHVAVGVHSGGSENSRAVALPSCPPPSPAPSPAEFSASTLAEDPWLQEKTVMAQTGAKTGLSYDRKFRARARSQTSGESRENVMKSKKSSQVCLGNTRSDVFHSNANDDNSASSYATPLQSAVHRDGVLLSSNSELELPSYSTSFRDQSSSQRERPQTQKGNRESPRSAAADKPVEQLADSRELGYDRTPQQPSKTHHRPIAFRKQSCRPDPPLAGHTETPGGQSHADVEDGLQRPAGNCAAVAARLCSAVQLPMLCRRNLLAESRETLLQALQERHGPQLTENLLRLEQYVGRSAVGPGVHGGDLRKGSTSDTEASVYREDVAGLEKSRPRAHGPDSNRRRRKQRFPQKVEPRLPGPQVEETAMKWNLSAVVDLADDPSGEFTKTNSPPLVMDFLPSLSSSPPTFLSSAWGLRPGQQLTDDRTFRNRTATVADERILNTGYSPEMCFFSQSKSLDNARPPFLQYSAFPVEGSEKDVTYWPQRPAASEISGFGAYSPSPLRRPLGHIHLQTHNSIHQCPPVLRSYSPDRIPYPCTDMQERALSPPRPLLSSYPSPDHWSFPRMRLY